MDTWGDKFQTSSKHHDQLHAETMGKFCVNYQLIMILSSFWMSFFSPIVLFSCSVLCSVICQQETKMQGWWGLNGFISSRQINGGWLQLTVRQHLPHKDYIVRMWHYFRLMVATFTPNQIHNRLPTQNIWSESDSFQYFQIDALLINRMLSNYLV